MKETDIKQLNYLLGRRKRLSERLKLLGESCGLYVTVRDDIAEDIISPSADLVRHIRATLIAECSTEVAEIDAEMASWQKKAASDA